MYELKMFGSKIIFKYLKDVISVLETDLLEIDEPCDIVVTPIEMTEEQYNNLNEFQGY